MHVERNFATVTGAKAKSYSSRTVGVHGCLIPEDSRVANEFPAMRSTEFVKNSLQFISRSVMFYTASSIGFHLAAVRI